ncbi:MAG: tRNA lysidine(34) synthetase TilS [Flavobacteriales bacterium]|nr:tRNA lysidine(34) synthetase TilS [Flavobacteriales bacterium]
MRQQLLDFIRDHALIHPDDKVLVAVSGGRDSIALAHALHTIGIKISIAHMNYRLRGEASEDDASFVEAFSKELGVAYHQKIAWDSAPKTNIQEAARQARYEHFEHLCVKHSYDKIATAHHFSDKVESLFINLIRGTGIHGLHGIPVQRGNIIRPLLWADRSIIDTYLSEHGLQWREDESNAKDAYLRNRIRHHLVPLLNELDIEAVQKLGGSMDRLQADAEAIDAMATKAVTLVGPHISIDLESFPAEHRATWLYHCLRPFGFNRSQCSDLEQAKQSGKKVEGSQYVAVTRKRGVDLLVKDPEAMPALRIEGPGTFHHHGITVELRPAGSPDNLTSGANVNVTLDAARLAFPLTLRNVNRTDHFQPLGLDYEVVLMDYLREKGAGPAEIAETFVLTEADGRIAWVPEVQIAQWCKIEAFTTSILSLSFRRNGD